MKGETEMIGYETSVKITFDDAGEEKISSAVKTIEEIVDLLQKAGGDTFIMEEELQTAACYLRAILDNIHW